MTKQEMRIFIKSAIDNHKIMNIYFRFEKNYYNAIPLIANEKLFLVINEEDFIFNGYSIYRYQDVTKIKIKDDKCDDILQKEGIFDTLTVPDINLTNWQSVFESLKALGNNIIIEKRTIDGKGSEFVIGNIEQIYKRFSYVRHFDADGAWQDEPYRIPYSEITNVIFASRYVTVFSKYIPAPPTDRV